MPTFGIVAEGETDQRVLEIVLHGYFQHTEVVSCRELQPVDKHSPGGWQRVFEWLRNGRAIEALSLNDYLVIHIDTDCQDEFGDTPRRENGVELNLTERVGRVVARLSRDLGADFPQDLISRILFAVAVEATECWLLPLIDPKKATDTKGCLDKANKAIRKKDRKGGLGTEEKKFPAAYVKASKEYRKRTTLIEEGRKNPSLALFLDQLDTRFPATESEPAEDGEAESA